MSNDEQLRQRPTNNEEAPAPAPASAKTPMQASAAGAAVTSALAPYLEKAKPAITKAIELFKIILPYIHIAHSKLDMAWVAIQPYHPEEILPCLVGLVLLFFGGQFVTLIAAAEAFKMCGWDRTKRCLRDLHEDYKEIKAEWEKDDLKDDDGDGIADVDQIDATQLVARKINLAIISCNPQRVTDALAGINAGWMAVCATLKVRFARAITLGATLGGILSRSISPYAEPALQQVIPQEYHKWIHPLVMYTCKMIGVSFAWTLQRVVSGLQSAVRGGQLFARGALSYAARHGALAKYLDKDGDGKPDLSEGSVPFMAVAYGLAFFGFTWQLFSGFSLPFPLNLILFPFTVTEWFVTYYISD